MMTDRPLRIAVADDEPDMRLFFRELLPHLGHEVAAEAATGRELIDGCRRARPDLVITDIRMPDMDGLQAAAAVNRETPVPVILVTAHHDADLLARAGAEYVMAYLTKPVKPVDLQAAIRLALVRYGQFLALHQEAAGMRQALDDRRLIERAKGIVMRRARIDELEAYCRLQRLAAGRNVNLVQYAQMILAADEAFQPPAARKGEAAPV
jgi:response regulator NasT